jgi:hypothetical protein
LAGGLLLLLVGDWSPLRLQAPSVSAATTASADANVLVDNLMRYLLKVSESRLQWERHADGVAPTACSYSQYGRAP